MTFEIRKQLLADANALQEWADNASCYFPKVKCKFVIGLSSHDSVSESVHVLGASVAIRIKAGYTHLDFRHENSSTIESIAGLVKPRSRVLIVTDIIDDPARILCATAALKSMKISVVGICTARCKSFSALRTLESKVGLPVFVAYDRPVAATSSSTTQALLPVENSYGKRNREEPPPLPISCRLRSRKKNAKENSIQKEKSLKALAPTLVHSTEYCEANSPCEDRSFSVRSPKFPEISMYAIIDGHGGVRAADFVQENLANEFFSRIRSSKCSEEKIIAALKESFMACDEKLRKSIASLASPGTFEPGLQNAGACCVMALFQGNKVFFAHCGDSRAILCTSEVVDSHTKIDFVAHTKDHNCENEYEVKQVKLRTSDRIPVRSGRDGSARVAGSLAITRAFGDFYLKDPNLSLAPFKSKVPYITSEPEISVYHLEDKSACIVLATDGLWEQLTVPEVLSIVTENYQMSNQGHRKTSGALIQGALQKAAERSLMSVDKLGSVCRGPNRRRIHDDITCSVISFRVK